MPSRLELPAVMLHLVGRPTTTRGALTGDLNPEIKGACLCIRLRCGLSEFDEIAEQKVHGPCAGMIFAHAREKSLLSNREVPQTFFCAMPASASRNEPVTSTVDGKN